MVGGWELEGRRAIVGDLERGDVLWLLTSSAKLTVGRICRSGRSSHLIAIRPHKVPAALPFSYRGIVKSRGCSLRLQASHNGRTPCCIALISGQ